MKFKIDHVKIILLMALLYVAIVPNVRALSPYVLIITTILLFSFAILSYVYRAKVDVGISLFLAFVYLLGRLKFDADAVDSVTYVLRTSAVLAFVFLHITLLFGPWSRFFSSLLPIYKHRRHFGVATFFLAATHASFIFHLYFNYSFSSAYQTIFVFFGYTGISIFLWMALTSWDYVQKKVKLFWWQILHAVFLLYYIVMAWYATHLSESDVQVWHKWVIMGFILFWFFVAPYGVVRRLVYRVTGWKQLHVLVYVAYISILIHVWLGVVSYEKEWIQSLFWILFGLVVFSHAVGWIQGWRERRVRARVHHDEVNIGGEKYYFLGRVSEFVPGKGRRFDVRGIPIAVYWYEGKFFAMSSVCPHQSGPIEKGEIVNGYVECPWHKYQFSVKDGRGPAGFKDCLPYYETLEREGKVYVSLTRVQNKDYHCQNG